MDLQFSTSPDVAAEIGRWLGYLGAEKRMSPKTLEAYQRDVAQFLGFLAEHLGRAPTLKALAKLSPADVRAFLAARRSDGAGNRSLMRQLAGARSFARFLERNGKGKVGALAAVRTPKLPRSLPKPLTASAARAVTDADMRAGEARAPWVLARDAAVLALLYGCGLRISEALSLTRRAFEGAPDALTVTGKGNKTRMVPLLPQVAKLAADYIALCPIRRRRTRCAIPSPRIFWPAAATCAPSRNCWATRRCRRRRSTPRSIPSVYSTFMRARTRARNTPFRRATLLASSPGTGGRT